MSYRRYNTRRIRYLRYSLPISANDLQLRQARKYMDNLRPFSNLRILSTTKRKSVFDRKRSRRNPNTTGCLSAGIKDSGKYDQNPTRSSTYQQAKCVLNVDINR